MMGESIPHTVQESVQDFTDDINIALSNKTKFVTVTGEDGKQYAVEAAKVIDIREA